MKKDLVILGPDELIAFPELHLLAVPSRIDTGARTSAIWASDIHVIEGVLKFRLFDVGSPFYTGEWLSTDTFRQRVVVSSNGAKEKRYLVKLLTTIGGRRIRGHFSLANRQYQVYPVLVGRNVLAGKFLVDVKRMTQKEEQPL